MPRQVTIGTIAAGAGSDGVTLPNGTTYTTAGMVVVLTDDEWAQISPHALTSGQVVDNGWVVDT